MIPTYHVYLDGKPYMGEDINKTYKTDVGSSNGWHMHNHGSLTMLVFGEPGDEPQEVSGWRGLNGAIERISRRVTDGVLSFEKIEIFNVTDGVKKQQGYTPELEFELRKRIELLENEREALADYAADLNQKLKKAEGGNTALAPSHE